MTETNSERIGQGLSLMSKGLLPFVEREMQAALGALWRVQANLRLQEKYKVERVNWNDPQTLVQVMTSYWNDVFLRTLTHQGRSWVSDLWRVRNRWAHMEEFNLDETYRALDDMYCLLNAASAPEANRVDELRKEVLRELAREKDNGELGTKVIEPLSVKGGSEEHLPSVDEGSRETFPITWNQLGFKTTLFVVHIHAQVDGKEINYHGRFSTDGVSAKHVDFKVDHKESDDEALRSRIVGFIRQNWRGKDEIRVLGIDDEHYRVERGASEEYEITARIARDKKTDTLKAFDFKREGYKPMAPFGDIIEAMWKKLT